MEIRSVEGDIFAGPDDPAAGLPLGSTTWGPEAPTGASSSTR
ncbi:hypothetical protein [Methylobacterium sp. B4]|nr:hypothetical protein [Methylobacterium sp. B4]PXW58549.1 hypothetical protein BY998_11221 [Methylobacterium sp. B4]